ncbi:MAG: hypothetical protein QE283_04135 [Rhodoferax sp.]|nr:hypothetical protein [Rhodoferax sp.]
MNTEEKNTRIAFERSFNMGFGTETDVRDRDCQIVISHDMANADAMSVENFFDIYKRNNQDLPLALNIKADGLQVELARLLARYEIKNYFVFDMAVPDGILYARQGINTYTRHSEHEPQPAFYDLAHGVWLDEFNEHWLTDAAIEAHLAAKKSICIVSPELHKRNHAKEWLHYSNLENKIGQDRMMLCTDFPEQAREFFNE